MLNHTHDASSIIHIPTPGDHYSSTSGSAVMTVIYELNRCHERAGGTTKLIVGRGTRHDYPVGQCVEVPFLALPNKARKIVDAALGQIGLPRYFLSQVYRPAVELISSTFEGVVIAHNAPVAMRGVKKAAPMSRSVLYCHNALFSTYSNRELRRSIAYADVVICVSEFLADGLRARIGRADSRVHGINNGVDIDRFTPGSTMPAGEVPVVLFVGRVLPEKGPDLLLKAAAKIADGRRRFKVRIVGSNNFNASDPLTPFEEELRVLAASIPGYVEFVPFVDRTRVLSEYHQASIFCAPSNWDEPCSLTVPEAMACGLPTIASRRGGIPEVGGEAVMYFETPDTDALAERLEYLIDTPSARAEWGQRARAQAESKRWQNQYELVRMALS